MKKNLKLEKGDVVVFKHEDEVGGDAIGPVVVIRGDSRLNYRDSDTISAISNEPYPDWLPRTEAVRIAREAGAEFRES